MFEEKENKFYYITVMNENYTQPEMPVGVEEGIIKGMYQLRKSKKGGKKSVELMGGGTILREVEAAALEVAQPACARGTVPGPARAVEGRPQRSGLGRQAHPEEVGNAAHHELSGGIVEAVQVGADQRELPH